MIKPKFQIGDEVNYREVKFSITEIVEILGNYYYNIRNDEGVIDIMCPEHIFTLIKPIKITNWKEVFEK